MKKLIFLILSLVVLIFFPQVKIVACTCVDMGEPLEEKIKYSLNQDTAIFVGK